jgi:hypothetical protein
VLDLLVLDQGTGIPGNSESEMTERPIRYGPKIDDSSCCAERPSAQQLACGFRL